MSYKSTLYQSQPRHTRTIDEVIDESKHFIEQYYASIKRVNTAAHELRCREIVKEVNEKGTYTLKETELIFGAKLAWRNAPRCIGRIQWSKLQVFDARYVSTAREMFEALCNHIKYATNKGNLRSAITIFPQRIGKREFRVWNLQLLSYAGYLDPDTNKTIGDPLNLEFTQLCEGLGWKSKRTKWDILPLVLSVPDEDPQLFTLPEELVLRVPIVHPKYNWFKELDLQWYALPAVSNMMFDVGGLEFPACPFSGWYMVTEIAARDLCDPQRYNVLEDVAIRMGLDVRTNSSLWKDAALVELNVAVLYSYQSANVTIVDHHTAAESFMKHLDNEQRLRGGCPADWVWVVPPISGSVLPVYHQEMLYYELKPSYEYQDPAWRTHEWHALPGTQRPTANGTPRKLRFKEIARAVKFTSNLFGKALSKRIKATILFATETGKSELFSKRLSHIFSHAFNVSVMCMDSYDMSHLEHEALLLIVTSTFGNGDPPENGEVFARQLQAIKMTGDTTPDMESVRNISTSYLRVSTSVDSAETPTNNNCVTTFDDGSTPVGPLSNIRFAVFGLGSGAYPNFCAFGRYLDTILADLGGERILKVGTGDELCGQEQSFGDWAKMVFEVACDVFCISDELNLKEVMKSATLKPLQWSKSNVKLVPYNGQSRPDICKCLSKGPSRRVVEYRLTNRSELQEVDTTDGRTTVLVELDAVDGKAATFYMPGDHLGVYPENRKQLVDGIVKHYEDIIDVDQVYQIMLKVMDDKGDEEKWIPVEKLDMTSLREALTRYLDITTPPTQQLLNLFTMHTTDDNDKNRLKQLATDSTKYEEWKAHGFPNLLEVLEEFPSLKLPVELLVTQMPAIQSRFYSISSSPLMTSSAQVDLTVAVVQYTTCTGTKHYGVCSNYLNQIPIGHSVYGFIRSAPNFRLPDDKTVPIIMVGPGSGIAPFRGFWQHRVRLVNTKREERHKLGKMTLFFGCRTPSMQLHRKEVQQMIDDGIISQSFIAYSRVAGHPKRYVQDCLKNESQTIYHQLMHERAHFYVCGDVSMAEDVCRTLKYILQDNGIDDPEVALVSLKETMRYHEDIFGITLRTAEVTTRGRTDALTKRSFSNA
ncbi:nitric oxide synthase, salivary gland-like [Oppia nitens]|uniref:nitric oxide synthase, salivary gland-like n=1 Tax=Oppia nitens TaxID=1686743 RepID=UPI0023DAE165|nr:nitric oxide synthase, salivary gland-like [Oppia nitens]